MLTFRIHKPHLDRIGLIILLLLLFAITIHMPPAARVLAFASLLVIAILISKDEPLLSEIGHQLCFDPFQKRLIIFNMLGIESGILIAFYYRHYYAQAIFPLTWHSFIIIAIFVAIVEELLFRGMIQMAMERRWYHSAPLLTALSHASYKSALFLPLLDSHATNIPSLFLGSFVAFIGLGYLKQFSKSIIPPIIAHTAFDIFVYADFAHAPWWVW